MAFLNLNNEQVTKALQKGTQTVVKNSPKLLTAAGIAGFFTTVIFAVKSKDKADLLINEALEQKKADAMERENAGEELEVPVDEIKLTPFEKFKAVIPAYWPTATMFVLSSAAVISSDVISDKRQIVATAAYTIADTSLKEYQEKTLQKFGEKKEKEIRDAITEDHVNKSINALPQNQKEKAMMYASNHSQYSFFQAPITKQLFFAKIDDVKSMFTYINERINRGDDITLNDILGELEELAIETAECGVGVEQNREIGNVFYWNETTGLLKVDYDSVKVPGTDVPCIFINIRTNYKAAIDPARLSDCW